MTVMIKRARIELRLTKPERALLVRASRLANDRTTSSWVRRVCLTAAHDEQRRATKRGAA